MGVYSSGTTQTRTNNKFAGYALPANPGYVRFLRTHIYVEGGGTNTTIQRWGWQRMTGATVTAATAEKASTRSPAFAGTAGTLESVAGTLSGNPYYFYGASQERFLTMRHLAYPRPNANPALYDTEQAVIVASALTGTSNVYDSDTVFSDDVPHVPVDHLPRRRGRKAGWWHIHRHGTELSGAGANQIVNNQRAALVYQVGRNKNVGWATRGFNLLNSGGPTTFSIAITVTAPTLTVTVIRKALLNVTASTVTTPVTLVRKALLNITTGTVTTPVTVATLKAILLTITTGTVSLTATVARKALLNIVTGTVTLPLTIVRKALLKVTTGNVSLTATDVRKALLNVTASTVSTPVSLVRKALLKVTASTVTTPVTVALGAVHFVTITVGTVAATASVVRKGLLRVATGTVSAGVTVTLIKTVAPIVTVVSWAVQSAWGSAWSLLKPPEDDTPAQTIDVPEQPDEPLR